MTLAQVFFCKFCEISKNTFFTEDHPATASEKSEYLLIKQFVEIFPKSRDCQCVFVRSIPPDVFLGKGVPKICTKFTRRTPMSKCDSNKAALQLKSHFGMGAFLWICCIFSEHLFLGTPLDGCFCIMVNKTILKKIRVIRPCYGSLQLLFWVKRIRYQNIKAGFQHADFSALV